MARRVCILRCFVLAVLALSVLLAAWGCGKRPLPGYGGHGSGAAAVEAGEQGPGATSSPGHVDVICLPGTGRERGVPDSLFNCLLHARDMGLGTVELPRGVYLGHVSEFIVRALKFYEIESHFERFYGYRVVLRLRPASTDEAGAARREGYLRTALGAAGDAGLFLAGAAWVPLTPIVFLFETAGTDVEREHWTEEAERAGLPRPMRSSGGVVLDRYKRRYAMLLGGDEAEDVMRAWVVEECYLEKPDHSEVVALASRWNTPPAPGRDFPSQGR